jgi:hypothetical protein
MSLQFLQVTETPNYLFRVYEKLALRIKSTEAVVRLTDKTPTPKPTTPKTR